MIMRKRLPLACNNMCFVLLLGFVIKCIVDYDRYTISYGSAPFRVWVMVNALYLVIPAIIVFAVGRIIKKNL